MTSDEPDRPTPADLDEMNLILAASIAVMCELLHTRRFF